jgi:hypothetical protein
MVHATDISDIYTVSYVIVNAQSDEMSMRKISYTLQTVRYGLPSTVRYELGSTLTRVLYKQEAAVTKL